METEKQQVRRTVVCITREQARDLGKELTNFARRHQGDVVLMISDEGVQLICSQS